MKRNKIYYIQPRMLEEQEPKTAADSIFEQIHIIIDMFKSFVNDYKSMTAFIRESFKTNYDQIKEIMAIVYDQNHLISKQQHCLEGLVKINHCYSQYFDVYKKITSIREINNHQIIFWMMENYSLDFIKNLIHHIDKDENLPVKLMIHKSVSKKLLSKIQKIKTVTKTKIETTIFDESM